MLYLECSAVQCTNNTFFCKHSVIVDAPLAKVFHFDKCHFPILRTTSPLVFWFNTFAKITSTPLKFLQSRHTPHRRLPSRRRAPLHAARSKHATDSGEVTPCRRPLCALRCRCRWRTMAEANPSTNAQGIAHNADEMTRRRIHGGI